MSQAKRRYPIGAELIGANQTHFRVWAPKAREVDVVLESAGDSKPKFCPLIVESGGYFSGAANVSSGTRYRFRVNGAENFYPDPASRLEGCVNDVFLMSSVLQEIGFDADDIRVVLDERATAATIRERIDWLLDGTADGHERVLYYSGHGAQLPDYNPAERIDHVDECLVPYDFHWTTDSAITDDDFLRYYSALPYAAKFFAIFDCCHSGGLTRDGARKIRAVTPPDDIRHGMLRWNKAEQMWEERDLRSLNPDFGGSREVDTQHCVASDELYLGHHHGRGGPRPTGKEEGDRVAMLIVPLDDRRGFGLHELKALRNGDRERGGLGAVRAG